MAGLDLQRAGTSIRLLMGESFRLVVLVDYFVEIELAAAKFMQRYKTNTSLNSSWGYIGTSVFTC